MRKDVKILIGLSDRRFLKAVVSVLKRTYTVCHSAELKDFADKVHKFEPHLIVIDYQFSGMKATDLYQGIELLHPHSIFVVRARKERLRIAKLLWKRRAIDYIVKNPSVFDFVQDINKVVRYIIERDENEKLRSENGALKKQISQLKKDKRLTIS